MKYWLIPSVFLLFSTVAGAQITPFLKLLQDHASKDSTLADSAKTEHPLYGINGLYYLQPLARQWQNLEPVNHPGKKREPGQNIKIAEALAFAGDYDAAVQFAAMDYDSMPPEGYQDVQQYLDTLKSVRFEDARYYILSRTGNEKMVMFNELHHLPAHRAFLLSLLPELKAQGFGYLALEMLNNRSDRSLQELNLRTGYFSVEPMAGELIRKAKSLGFKLIAYEDTLADNHSGTGRDAIQAAHLAGIFQMDPGAKVVVLAGGAHISEQQIGKNYIPMAVAFRRFTGINPLTIDQTELSEGSSFEYGRYFHQSLLRKWPLQKPVIIMRDGLPVSLLENDHYDIQVIHPILPGAHKRPAWLSVEGGRKAVAIRPTEKKLFLVQAYYAEEIQKTPSGLLVPADQTYITGEDGYYWLYLYPGKYKLLLRDLDYHELSSKDLEVQP